MKNKIILIIVACAMFMESVDTTIINTAIPVMAHNFQVNPVDLKLALISYLLSLAVFIPISGWLADKFGTKKVFMCALVCFTISSLWCGFTHNLLELIAARFVQGLGGSLMLPLGRLILIRTYKRHELITKMSGVVMIASFGMMLGPVLGGLITTHFSWRWIFWVNIPFGLLTLLLSYRLLPAMPAKRIHALDKLGFLLFGSGLATLILGLSSLSESNLSPKVSLLLIALALSLLILYITHSRKQRHPIVKMKLLQTRTFGISVKGNLLSRMGFGGIPFLLPLLFQIILGFSPQLSGLLLVPIALGVLLAKPLSFFVIRQLGYKKLLILNTFLIGLSLWSFATINLSSTLYWIELLTFLYGFLMALQFTGMNSLAYANIAQENISAATSIMSMIPQLSQSVGVAIAAIILKFGSVGFSVLGALTLHTFHLTFFLLGIFTMCSIFIFFKLKDDDGYELINIEPV